MSNNQPEFPNGSFDANSFDKDGLPTAKNGKNDYKQAGYSNNPQMGYQNPQQSDYPNMPVGAMHATPAGYGAVPGYSQPKSWVVALLLAWFLGMLGAHNFYLGHSGRGIAQLLLTVFGFISMFVFVGFIILPLVWIWVAVEFIMILVGAGSYRFDSNGQPLKK